MHTSTSSDSRSNVRGSKSPFSSVKRFDSDCEKARVWVGAVNNAVRRAKRRPEAVKGLAEWRAGVAMAEREGVARENREDRISRLNRGRTAPFDAIAACEIVWRSGAETRITSNDQQLASPDRKGECGDSGYLGRRSRMSPESSSTRILSGSDKTPKNRLPSAQLGQPIGNSAIIQLGGLRQRRMDGSPKAEIASSRRGPLTRTKYIA